MNTLRPKLTLLDGQPTPLHYASGLSQELFREIYIKRDDLTPLGGGGHSLRKLEYLLFGAVNAQSSVIVTVGAMCSDHARLTAAAAARYGLSCIIVTMDDGGGLNGSALLAALTGARFVIKKDDGRPKDEQLEEAVKTVMTQEIERGERVYFIPAGGSDVTGMLGYYDGAAEIDSQARASHLEGATIFTAVSSLGTYVGLYCGLKAIGSSLSLTGIAVSPIDKMRLHDYFCRAKDEYGFAFDDSDMHIETGYVRKGFNEPDRRVRDAVRFMARHEGIILDPCCTGKVFAALLDMIKEKKIKLGRKIILLHTGGMPSLFEPLHRSKLEKELQDQLTYLP